MELRRALAKPGSANVNAPGATNIVHNRARRGEKEEGRAEQMDGFNWNDFDRGGHANNTNFRLE